jgi:hypothetical protein
MGSLRNEHPPPKRRKRRAEIAKTAVSAFFFAEKRGKKPENQSGGLERSVKNATFAPLKSKADLVPEGFGAPKHIK